MNGQSRHGWVGGSRGGLGMSNGGQGFSIVCTSLGGLFAKQVCFSDAFVFCVCQVVIVAPCGFKTDKALEQAKLVTQR